MVFGLVPDVFGNPAPFTIAAMFIIRGALVRAGLLDALASRVVVAALVVVVALAAAWLSHEIFVRPSPSAAASTGSDALIGMSVEVSVSTR